MTKYFIVTFLSAFLFAGCKNNQKNKTVTANASETISAPKNTNKTFKNIHIQAKPDSIAIDTASTAVVVVDMENDFGSKGGMFDRAGIDISMIQKL